MVATDHKVNKLWLHLLRMNWWKTKPQICKSPLKKKRQKKSRIFHLISVIGFIEVRRKLESLTIKSDNCKLDCLLWTQRQRFGRSLFNSIPKWDWISIFRNTRCAVSQKQHMANETNSQNQQQQLQNWLKKKTQYFIFGFGTDRFFLSQMILILNFVTFIVHRVRHTVMFNKHTYTGCQVDCVLRLTFRRQRLNIILNYYFYFA